MHAMVTVMHACMLSAYSMKTS